MMIEPSIDVLTEKTKGNRYVLCNLIAKRAKNIETVKGAELANKDKKSITLACEEIATGKVVASDIKKADDTDTMAF